MLELENNLEEDYGYLGLDFRERNVEGVEEIEVCGYAEMKSMWSASGPLRSSE